MATFGIDEYVYPYMATAALGIGLLYFLGLFMSQTSGSGNLVEEDLKKTGKKQ